jgi:hypothetical protein
MILGALHMSLMISMISYIIMNSPHQDVQRQQENHSTLRLKDMEQLFYESM